MGDRTQFPRSHGDHTEGHGGFWVPECERAPESSPSIEKAREAGGEVISMEGEDSGEWVLVDLGDIVVHVMQPTVRQYYNLEELWQTTPAQRRKAVEQAAAK